VAPLAPLGKQGLLKLIKQRGLPLAFGSPHPCVVVIEQERVFRVRELVVDPDEASAAGKAALSAGKNWRPEDYYRLGKPTGKIHLEAKTLDALVAKIERFSWPKHW